MSGMVKGSRHISPLEAWMKILQHLSEIKPDGVSLAVKGFSTILIMENAKYLIKRKILRVFEMKNK